jgi:hypothetical protein
VLGPTLYPADELLENPQVLTGCCCCCCCCFCPPPSCALPPSCPPPQVWHPSHPHVCAVGAAARQPHRHPHEPRAGLPALLHARRAPGEPRGGGSQGGGDCILRDNNARADVLHCCQQGSLHAPSVRAMQELAVRQHSMWQLASEQVDWTHVVSLSLLTCICLSAGLCLCRTVALWFQHR